MAFSMVNTEPSPRASTPLCPDCITPYRMAVQRGVQLYRQYRGLCRTAHSQSIRLALPHIPLEIGGNQGVDTLVVYASKCLRTPSLMPPM